MAKKDVAARVECPSCGHKWQVEGALQMCVICRNLFCQRCAVVGYGREFCSQSCREFFFHGEDEDEEADD